MRYLSVCSGIEAASVAWHPLGWTPVAFSEIEAFPSAVLEHHYPHVPNYGDMTKFREWPDLAIDLLVGGTPCQSFSVAGLRKGMADPRGNLALTYLAIADRYRPQWLVWENVPGVLSSNSGRDFGAFLGGLVELGYGWAYRVIDAQYCRVDGFSRAVPQRRRRVFVVGHLGDWRRAAAVLFERESLSGHPAPRREAGKGIAPTIAARPTGGGGIGTDFDCDGGLIPQVCGTLSDGAHMGGGLNGQDAYSGRIIPVAHSLRVDGFDTSEDGTGRGTPLVPVEVVGTLKSCKDSGGWSNSADHAAAGYMVPVCFSAKDHGADALENLSPTLRAGGHSESHANAGVMPAVAFYPTNRQPESGNYENVSPAVKIGSGGQSGNPPAIAFGLELGNQGSGGNIGWFPASGPSRTLDTGCAPGIATEWAVRRLTPTECERLQGFPDNYTDVPYRNKPAVDGPRYKALGNSMAVNCMRWLGRRIELVNSILADKEAA